MLGVIRGLFAVYALIGLVTYGMAILIDMEKTAHEQAGGQTVQRSMFPLHGEGDFNLRIVSVSKPKKSLVAKLTDKLP